MVLEARYHPDDTVHVMVFVSTSGFRSTENHSQKVKTISFRSRRNRWKRWKLRKNALDNGETRPLTTGKTSGGGRSEDGVRGAPRRGEKNFAPFARSR